MTHLFFIGFHTYFKKVQLNCSIDGFGLTLTPVVQFHNAIDLVDLFTYFEEIWLSGRGKVNIDPIFLNEPAFLSMAVLPEVIRRRAVEKLQEFALRSEMYKNNLWAHKGINGIIQALSAEQELDKGIIDANKRYTNAIDSHRSMYLKDYAPELYSMLYELA